MNPDCKIFIVMGKTDPDGADIRRQQSMIWSPRHPGVTVKRGDAGLRLRGPLARRPRRGRLRHARVPVTNLVGRGGRRFAIAQARARSGPYPHCMRLIGMAERAIELMSNEAVSASRSARALAQQAWSTTGSRTPGRRRAAAAAGLKTPDDGHRREQGAHTEIQSIKIATPRTVSASSTGRSSCTARRREPGLPAGELYGERPHPDARRRPGRGAPTVAGAAGVEEVPVGAHRAVRGVPSPVPAPVPPGPADQYG